MVTPLPCACSVAMLNGSTARSGLLLGRPWSTRFPVPPQLQLGLRRFRLEAPILATFALTQVPLGLDQPNRSAGVPCILLDLTVFFICPRL
jgi:hypothetical protein